MLRKILYTLFILILVLVIFAVGILFYIKPDRELNWTYNKVSITDKAWQMVKDFKLELDLSEDELNDLFKEHFADKAKLPNGIEILGTHFDLQGNSVVADINLEWNGMVDVGARVRFDLEWQQGNLVVKHSQTNFKAIRIPSNMFHIPTVRIPIDSKLPEWVAIKDLTFEPNHIHIKFKLK